MGMPPRGEIAIPMGSVDARSQWVVNEIDLPPQGGDSGSGPVFSKPRGKVATTSVPRLSLRSRRLPLNRSMRARMPVTPTRLDDVDAPNGLDMPQWRC